MAATANDPRGQGALITAASIFAISLAITIFAFASKSLRRASYERALVLADRIGLNDEGRILLWLNFGRLTPEQAKQALEDAAQDRQELARLKAEQTQSAATPG